MERSSSVESPEALRLRGNECYQAGRFDEARECYDVAIAQLSARHDSRDEPTVRVALAQLHSNRAQTFIQERSFAQAAQDATQALAFDATNEKAQLRLLVALENLERFEQAFQRVERILDHAGARQRWPTLFEYAITARRRLSKAIKQDRAAAKNERVAIERMVHKNQQLRINFGSTFPSRIVLGEFFDVAINIGNEFGLFRRDALQPGLDQDILLAESPGNLGIGGKLWDSCLVLTRYLQDYPDLLRGRQVIELGSGLGLVGIYCAMMGAHVTLTDMDEVIPLLHYNIRLNFKGGETTSSRNVPRAVAHAWGTTTDSLPSDPDVIVMSDVVYDPEGYAPLVASLEALAKTSDTTILMAHRSRNPMEGQFFDLLGQQFESELSHQRPSIVPSMGSDADSKGDEITLDPKDLLIVKDGTIRVAHPYQEPEPQYDANGELIKASGTWTQSEHERFLKAIAMYPKGPWKAIAAMVGSRTVRQTQTHAQKYREKLARRLRGLRNRNGTLQTPPMHISQLMATTPVFGHLVMPSPMYQQTPQSLGILSSGEYGAMHDAMASPTHYLSGSPNSPASMSSDIYCAPHSPSFFDHHQHHPHHAQVTTPPGMVIDVDGVYRPIESKPVTVHTHQAQWNGPSPSTRSSATAVSPDFAESMDFLMHMYVADPAQASQHHRQASSSTS
ncbi:hypothetical protein ATCC90586_000622 [Pythium insidiosum]|nr:hypothetical protein ATCC90586_000622 [Pythium insidiosum]